MSDSECSYAGEENEDFEEKFTELKLQWKNALKKSKKLLLKCPNYERCQFKCGSVGGMQYHYVRCTGKSPQFKCDLCKRSYESKTGLNYHMASNHSSSSMEDTKFESTGRPQRSTALSTMTAILLTSNPPPLKQISRGSGASCKSTKISFGKLSSPATLQPQPPKMMDGEEEENKDSERGEGKEKEKGRGSQKSKAKSRSQAAPAGGEVKIEVGDGREDDYEEEEEEEEEGSEVGEEEEEEEEEERGDGEDLGDADLAEDKKKTDMHGKQLGGSGGETKTGHPKRRGAKEKKEGKAVNIPSIEYPDEYKSFLPSWRQEMKDNKVIKCPNYQECEFKCTTVNGMKYHYVRCNKSNPPEFKCEECQKKFQCRTGLVWHLKKTHNLLDMHPSKEGGGFQGIIASDGSATAEGATSEGVISRKRRGFGGRRGGKRRRLRKCVHPRRTAEEILQNIINIRYLPEPKLGPETLRCSIPSCEYLVADYVPTDIDPKASAIITLGEEALEWHQMSSDESDSEYDYDDEYMSDGEVVESESVGVAWGNSGGAVAGGKIVVREEVDEEAVLGSCYSKSSSSSDSDEDYTVPYQRKRGGGSGRGRGRRGRGGGAGSDSRVVASSPVTPRPVGRPRSTPSGETKPSVPPSSSVAVSAPPPLVSQQMGPPTLIKADHAQTSQLPLPQSSNSLVQPLKVGVVQGSDGSIKRDPPPLVRKPDSLITTQAQGQVATGTVGGRQPRFILPSPGVGGESLAPGGTLVTTPPPPIRRRPGRPRKDQSVTFSSSQTQRTSRIVHHLGQGQGQGRGRGRGRGRGGGMVGLATNTPAASGKIKVTQYEFQEHRHRQQQQSIANQGVYFTTPTNHTSSTTQFQPILLQPGSNSALHSSIVTPLQIVSSTQATPTPLQMQTIPTVSPGSVIYLQNSSPQLEQSPQYITKDGQLYQVLAPTTAAGLVGDQNKKLGVIMQPSAATPTYIQASEIGNIQYVTQLDGPPPSLSNSSSNPEDQDGRESLKRKFELVRQKMAIVQLDGIQPAATASERGGSSGPGSSGTGEGSGSCDRNAGGSGCMGDNGSEDVSSQTRKRPSGRLDVSLDNVGCEKSSMPGKSSSKKSGVTKKGKRVGSSGQGEDTGNGGVATSSGSVPMVKKMRRSVSPASPLGPGSSHGVPSSPGPGPESRAGEGVCSEVGASPEAVCMQGAGVEATPIHTSGVELLASPQCEVHGCSDCGRKFSSRKRLKNHTLSRHASQQLKPEDSLEACQSYWRKYMGLKAVSCHKCRRFSSKSVDTMTFHWETCSTTSKSGSGEEPSPGGVAATSFDLEATPPTSPRLSGGTRSTAGLPSSAKSSKRFVCEDCGQVYRSRGGLQYHKLSHQINPLKPEDSLEVCRAYWKKSMRRSAMVTCHLCSKYSSRVVSTMVCHWKTCGKTKPEVKCEHCGKVYKSIPGLKYHLNACHSATSLPPDTPGSTTTGEKGEGQEEDEPMDYLPSRKAAMAARSKMTDTLKELAKESIVVPPQVDYTGLTAQLRDSGLVSCPLQGCDGRTFRSLAGIRYHVNHFHTKAAEQKEGSSDSRTNERSSAELKGRDSDEAEAKGERECSVGGEDRSVEDGVEEQEGVRDEAVASLRTQLHQTRLTACPNKGCSKTFKSRKGLKYHLSRCGFRVDEEGQKNGTVGAVIKEYICQREDCNRKFRSKLGLKYHVDTSHQDMAEWRETDEDNGSIGSSAVTQLEEELDLDVLKKKLQKSGEVCCPSKGCERTFRSLNGLRYHHKTCHAHLERNSRGGSVANSEEFVPSEDSGEEEEEEEEEEVEELDDSCLTEEKTKSKAKQGSVGNVGRASKKAGKHKKGSRSTSFNWSLPKNGWRKKLVKRCGRDEQEEEVMVEGDKVVCTRSSQGWTFDKAKVKRNLRNYRKITCPVKGCGLSYGTMHGLKYHVNTHHPVGTKRRFRCSHCGLGLNTKKSALKHLHDQHQLLAATDEDVAEMEIYSPPRDKPHSSESDSEIERDPSDQLKNTISYKTYGNRVSELFSQSSGHLEESLLAESEWRPTMEDWSQISDYSSFLPLQTRSMEYRVHMTQDTKSTTGRPGQDTSCSLGLFQAAPMEGLPGAIFFTGGPVWAMDWQPSHTPSDDLQVVALSSYRDLDETHSLSRRETGPGLIQLWSFVGEAGTGPVPSPRLCSLLVLDCGPVMDLQWYPGSHNVSSSSDEAASSGRGSTGLLAVACGDGSVRVLGISEELLRASSSGDEPTVVQSRCLRALLLPSGAGAHSWTEFGKRLCGKCLCLDWSSGTTNRLVAGFSNGVVCVWDLKTTLFHSPGCDFSQGDMPPSCNVFFPTLQIPAHSYPCRCVRWCPTKQHLFFTGGLDKKERVWDIRQPFSPLEDQEKTSPVVCMEWLKPWCCWVAGKDMINFQLPSSKKAITYRCFDEDRKELSVYTTMAPLCDLSYSMWTDRLACTSFAGELSLLTFPTFIHYQIQTSMKMNKFSSNYQRLIFGSHLEPLEKEGEGEADHPRPKKTYNLSKSYQTHRLVFTPHWVELDDSPYSLSVDMSLLPAFTKVCWNSNRSGKEWLVVCSNSGLACLLHVPLTSTKPT